MFVAGGAAWGETDGILTEAGMPGPNTGERRFREGRGLAGCMRGWYEVDGFDTGAKIWMKPMIKHRIAKKKRHPPMIPPYQLPLSLPPESQLPLSLLPESQLPLSEPPESQLPLSPPPESQLPLSLPPESQLPLSEPPESQLPPSQLPLSLPPLAESLLLQLPLSPPEVLLP